MALLALWIPILIVAHAVAIGLLFYSVFNLFCSRLTIPAASQESPAQSVYERRGVVHLRWEGLSCWLQNKSDYQILFECKGSGSSGEVIGIMGPSGSGKSTLIDVLLGERRTYRCDGRIFVNDQPASRAVMSCVASYVPQSMALVPILSVAETVTFRARLTPSSQQHAEERVTEVLGVTGDILSIINCCGQKTLARHMLEQCSAIQ